MQSTVIWWGVLGGITACTTEPVPTTDTLVQLPSGEPGIGLDDLRYSAALDKLVVAAGRTGAVDLIDPVTLELTSIDGFTAFASFDGGDQQGVESADEGDGLVFAVDRAAFTLSVIDPAQQAIVATTPLDRTEPDYVRFSASRDEVWISNVNRGRVEVLSVSGTSPPVHAAFVSTGGPEGLAIDDERGRVYVRDFGGDVVVVDMATRAVVDRWATGCDRAHGIPIVDPERPFVYVGCGGASVVVLDATDGSPRGRFALGPGASIIAYSPALHHLYLRGDGHPEIVELAVSPDGELAELDRFTTTTRGHCMAADAAGGLWVCDWTQGRLLRFTDIQPATP
jgi:hypothetical protein